MKDNPFKYISDADLGLYLTCGVEERSVLDERTQQVLAWKFYDGLRQNDIALKISVSPSRVGQIVRSGMRKLRIQRGKNDRADFLAMQNLWVVFCYTDGETPQLQGIYSSKEKAWAQGRKIPYKQLFQACQCALKKDFHKINVMAFDRGIE